MMITSNPSADETTPRNTAQHSPLHTRHDTRHTTHNTQYTTQITHHTIHITHHTIHDTGREIAGSYAFSRHTVNNLQQLA